MKQQFQVESVSNRTVEYYEICIMDEPPHLAKNGLPLVSFRINDLTRGGQMSLLIDILEADKIVEAFQKKINDARDAMGQDPSYNIDE